MGPDILFSSGVFGRAFSTILQLQDVKPTSAHAGSWACFARIFSAPNGTVSNMSNRDSEFLKDRQDRIPADSEMVGQILNPARTAETVKFPDPSLSRDSTSNRSQTPQSMPEMVMARRTDAGRHETVTTRVLSKRRTTISLVLGIAFLVMVLAALGWLFTH